MSLDIWIWIKKIWYIHNGILLSHWKEWNWVICRDVDGSLLFTSIQLWQGHPSSPFTKAGGRLFQFRTRQVGCLVFLVLSSSGPNPSLYSFYFVVRKVQEIGKEKIYLPKGQCCCCCSWLSHVWLFVTPWTAARQTSLSFTISWSLLRLMFIELMMDPTISSSVAPFSSCPQSVPGSGSFLVSWLFKSCGQSIGVSAWVLVLPINIQGWFPLGLTGLILQSKGLSRDFSRTTVQKHQFFGAKPFLWSISHIHTWLLEKP